MEGSVQPQRLALPVKICQDQCVLTVGRAKQQVTNRTMVFGRSGCGGIDAICCKSGNRASKTMSKAAWAPSRCACEVIVERGYDQQQSHT